MSVKPLLSLVPPPVEAACRRGSAEPDGDACTCRSCQCRALHPSSRPARPDDPVVEIGPGADDPAVLASQARRSVTRVLEAVDPELVDVAVLLVSELVGNATVHGEDPVATAVSYGAGVLRVEVSDGGPAFAPQCEMPGSDAESGRGLALVESLASRWGLVERGDGRPGKTLWFEIDHSREQRR